MRLQLSPSFLSYVGLILGIFLLVFLTTCGISAQNFVTASVGKLMMDGREYRFVGTNYWYASLLALDKDKKRGIERLCRELDFLKSQGVTNLRLLAGAEGSGLLNGVERVGPSIQPTQDQFNSTALDGLDIVLYEMSKRKMKAVIFFSNNWEWSGGFQQYLIWNNKQDARWLTEKPDWDTLRDNVANFYSCGPCTDSYERQMRFVLARKNSINGKKYIDDPTIMAWEIANEPRPMRPSANGAYKAWLSKTSAAIRSLDSKHLITIGHEGSIGTESIELFQEIHADKNIDYLTIHIWPKNWNWFTRGKLAEELSKALATTEKYIAESAAVAVRLKKPLVIEEFGLPRDGESFDIGSTTVHRDKYYSAIFAHIGKTNISGAAFWAFGGYAEPIKGQPFWKMGDEYMGDPPMEEQGLNSVFASDKSTWKVISSTAKRISQYKRQPRDCLIKCWWRRGGSNP